MTITAILCVWILSCQVPNAEQAQSKDGGDIRTLETSILGTWENVSLSVTIYSANDTDSIETISITREEWEETLGIKPIHTTYSGDGKFISEYRDLNDSLVNKEEGSWVIINETLALTSNDVITKYRTEFKNDTASFSGYLDWDGDGKTDDLYSGVQRKL